MTIIVCGQTLKNDISMRRTKVEETPVREPVCDANI